jgi:RNA polymerase sigma-70 factor (ECF subfamily)
MIETDDPNPPATALSVAAPGEPRARKGSAANSPVEPSPGSAAGQPVEDAAERSRVDLQLLRRAAGGDGAAFNGLVERHAKSMHRLAYMLVGSAADAEDILQETWTGVYKSLKRFEGRTTVRTWLTRILTTQVALWRRKRRGGIVSLDDSRQAQEDTLPGKGHSASRHSDWQADLEVALKQLSTDHREVIVLREIEGLSYDEIADSLRIPRGTVESRLHRARGELRKLLSAYITQ